MTQRWTLFNTLIYSEEDLSEARKEGFRKGFDFALVKIQEIEELEKEIEQLKVKLKEKK